LRDIVPRGEANPLSDGERGGRDDFSDDVGIGLSVRRAEVVSDCPAITGDVVLDNSVKRAGRVDELSVMGGGDFSGDVGVGLSVRRVEVNRVVSDCPAIVGGVVLDDSVKRAGGVVELSVMGGGDFLGDVGAGLSVRRVDIKGVVVDWPARMGGEVDVVLDDAELAVSVKRPGGVVRLSVMGGGNFSGDAGVSFSVGRVDDTGVAVDCPAVMGVEVDVVLDDAELAVSVERPGGVVRLLVMGGGLDAVSGAEINILADDVGVDFSVWTTGVNISCPVTDLSGPTAGVDAL
jgi:hypothetical protein